MRPLDPRLLRYASATRGTLAAGAGLAMLQTASIISFAWLLTDVVVRAIAGEPLASLSPTIGLLGLVVVVRAGLLWAVESVSSRGGARVVGQLREGLVAAVGRLGPGWVARRSTADVTLVAGHGMDALDGYFAKYLPQLIGTAIATPLLVLTIGWRDLTSGIILVITLPLIPVFMVLVGWATQAAQKRQWRALSTLSSGFLDVVAGLSTLKLFGRQHRQEARIRQVSDQYRVHTMRVLRMSFLSGFVLELAASLSVAVIAVTIGLRLLGGSLDLSVGLFVLLLAPEAFLPLRNVGASYHAAAEGIEAASNAFEVIEAAEAMDAVTPDADVAAGTGLVLEDVRIAYDGRTVVDGFSAAVPPGTLAVLRAPSGAGKSSLVSAVLGFTAFEGRIHAGGRTDAVGRREAIAWAGQRPGLLAGSIASNVALGDASDASGTDARVEDALRDAAATELDPTLELGPGGSGLSGGQAQRVAVARALYRLRSRRCPVLILDEPTSALDAETEARLLRAVRRAADDGAAVLVVSHRPAVAEAADVVLTLPARDASDGVAASTQSEESEVSGVR
ncbi:ATP-binding cassette, subfamily C, CydD [Leifsonia sp. 98AMF]|uniref:thiol reductant ABC exporter subunit CydD n=1 Tax=unclassified Leifsonia TaxID=2663824 RepID=UPI00087D671F|nr:MULTISPECIES: thiol reductant ABC exporter subunit CydD [unclassified Leifsonia]SDH31440.1 ATP-binding cassette, subfamily C, CydD [Leifsonia sp. 197AMF]SDJ03169.1 ATP-binding cassette, subfamily C, CydD [Leifsonia sp. 466MF]SDJ69747.1 ATP-binding cassette, subfamily C, CydD [Leifsonia sp. 157MF]SDO06937.1 ATP-binding cassette, subfamily C, CydD [Leifsonia sp. 509MF]SEM97013.1 ATP-binding cassette, subfamily C, CydD [Leifsonia sp. 467MF]